MTGAGLHKTFLSRPLHDDQAQAISTTVGQGQPEFARQSTGKCKRCLTNDISGMQRAKPFDLPLDRRARRHFGGGRQLA